MKIVMRGNKVIFRLFFSIMVMMILYIILDLQGMWSIETGIAIVIAGLLSYFILGLFSAKNIKITNANGLSELSEDTVIIEGMASHVTNNVHEEGKLLLTIDRLVFQSQTKGVAEFMLSKISAIKLYTAGKFLQKGISIIVDGRSENFELEYPRDWQKIIEGQINKETQTGITTLIIE